jgi:hypothetical protein
MTAVDEYHRLMASKTLKPSKKVTRDAIAELEAELAALKAENERLKCCGNCGSYGVNFSDCNDDPDEELPDAEVEASDPCHFTPSRWQACEEATP